MPDFRHPPQLRFKSYTASDDQVEMTNIRPITLTELLESRDARRDLQLRLLADNPGHTLAVGTVIVPGNIKRNDDSLIIAQAMIRAIEMSDAMLTPCIVRDLPTGFEAYYTSPLSPDKVKTITSEIENTHPLGRMMDIDIFTTDGTQVSRTGQGDAPRRCLLCGKDARICMRAFSHTQEELLAEIHRRVKLWLRDESWDTP